MIACGPILHLAQLTLEGSVDPLLLRQFLLDVQQLALNNLEMISVDAFELDQCLILLDGHGLDSRSQRIDLLAQVAYFPRMLFTQLLKPVLAKIHRVTCEEVRHSVQKERRICDTLEPVMNSHKLVIDRKVIEKDHDSTRHLPPEKALRYQLIYQMSRVTRHKGALAHDDRLDVLAMGVAYWAEQMAQDADDQIARRKDEALRDELENFAQGVLGRKPRPLSWF